MGYFTEYVRQQIAKKDINSAMVSLLASLEYGDKQLYESALALSKKREGKPKSGNSSRSRAIGKQLSDFLSQLEQKHESMLEFVYHIDQGNSFYDRGIWMRAQEHYLQAKGLHQPGFRLDHDQLSQKIQLCYHAIQYNYYNDLGQESLETRVWQKAINHFKQARAHCVEGLPYSTQMIEEKIQLAVKGINFERHLDMALGLQSQKRWEHAITEYKKAATLYNKGFEPTSDEIQDAIKDCENHKYTKHYPENEKNISELIEEKSDYSKMLFPLMLVILGFIFLFFLTSSPESDASLTDDMLENIGPDASTVSELAGQYQEIEQAPESKEMRMAEGDSWIEADSFYNEFKLMLIKLPDKVETGNLAKETRMSEVAFKNRTIEIIENQDKEE